MARLSRLPILLLALLCASHAATAGVYRCDVIGQRAEYQSTPCANGQSVVVKVPAAPPRPSATSSHAEGAPPTPQDTLKAQRALERSQQFPFDNRLSLDLPNAPLGNVLQIIADFVGYGLSVDPTVSAVGNFSYKSQPASLVLADVAARFKLLVRTDKHTITVTRQ
jgi:hypothetical protein